jgi:hypothetical protein
LRDVALKPEVAADFAHTQFDIQKATIGHLKVRIPWTSLTSSPVQIKVEDIKLVVSPKEKYEVSYHSII